MVRISGNIQLLMVLVLALPYSRLVDGRLPRDLRGVCHADVAPVYCDNYVGAHAIITAYAGEIKAGLSQARNVSICLGAGFYSNGWCSGYSPSGEVSTFDWLIDPGVGTVQIWHGGVRRGWTGTLQVWIDWQFNHGRNSCGVRNYRSNSTTKWYVPLKIKMTNKLGKFEE